MPTPWNRNRIIYFKQKRLGLETFWISTACNCSIGVDNLLDETYSLGNDINAMGNRYFNPAAPRNYYAGMKFML